MEYKKIELGSYNIHIIKTNIFKNVLVRVGFKQVIKKDTITERNILTEVLTYANKTYDTHKKVSIREEELYSSNLSVGTYRFGAYISTDFYISILNDKYTEKNNMKEAITYLRDVIYNPLVTNKHFDKKIVDMIKIDVYNYLTRIKENSSRYSMMRMNEVMAKDRPNAFRMCGYIEDLAKIDEKSLYNHYNNMLKTSMIDIFVIGDVKFKEIEDIVKENFASNVLKKKRTSFYLPVEKAKRCKTVIETLDLNQSKLSIGCYIDKLTEYEQVYVLPLYNIILGGMNGDSKLFKTVREDNSLCYYIASTSSQLDRTLTILAGISKNNLKQVVKLINKCLSEMRRGKFTDAEIEKAKEFYLTDLDEIEESEARIIDNYYVTVLLNLDNYMDKYEKVRTVTKNDIMRVAKKIKVNTIYCLEGAKDEGN